MEKQKLKVHGLGTFQNKYEHHNAHMYAVESLLKNATTADQKNGQN